MGKMPKPTPFESARRKVMTRDVKVHGKVKRLRSRSIRVKNYRCFSLQAQFTYGVLRPG